MAATQAHNEEVSALSSRAVLKQLYLTDQTFVPTHKCWVAVRLLRQLRSKTRVETIDDP